MEYVKEEAKMVYLLECLQKTPPPVSTSSCYDIDMCQKSVSQTCQMLQNIVCSCWQVLIFAEKKADVDAIHEYLLLKGVEAVAIHGGKGAQNSILIIKRHNSRYTIIVPAEEDCIWITYHMHTALLFTFLVVAHQYHQMPSCLQMSPCLRHSLLNISKA